MEEEKKKGGGGGNKILILSRNKTTVLNITMGYVGGNKGIGKRWEGQRWLGALLGEKQRSHMFCDWMCVIKCRKIGVWKRLI